MGSMSLVRVLVRFRRMIPATRKCWSSSAPFLADRMHELWHQPRPGMRPICCLIMMGPWQIWQRPDLRADMTRSAIQILTFLTVGRW
jgi:hypothetical protein